MDLMISGADSHPGEWLFFWSQNLHNVISNLPCFSGALGCSAASAASVQDAVKDTSVAGPLSRK